MSPKTRDLVQKMQDQLRPTGWYDLLRVFLHSSDFSDIIVQLEKLVEDDIRFTPPVRQLFQPFVQCPLSSLKVVIVAAGPHAQLGVADGLALSASQPGVCPTELNRVLDAIQQEFEHKAVGSQSLKRWASQGVLLLNMSLTTQLDREAKHADLWNPFFMYLLDRLLFSRPDLYWVWYNLPTSLTEDFEHLGFRHYIPSSPPILAKTLSLINASLLADAEEPIKW